MDFSIFLSKKSIYTSSMVDFTVSPVNLKDSQLISAVPIIGPQIPMVSIELCVCVEVTFSEMIFCFFEKSSMRSRSIRTYLLDRPITSTDAKTEMPLPVPSSRAMVLTLISS
ncbi:hypothetical protein SDC9_127714 [bioreactor metagenome]|uniref:Uncharacterized protein n=1 Tax=bioreactor metagenome TaxID=1076179 RepID=A0A645CUU5_9ZZZZ